MKNYFTLSLIFVTQVTLSREISSFGTMYQTRLGEKRVAQHAMHTFLTAKDSSIQGLNAIQIAQKQIEQILWIPMSKITTTEKAELYTRAKQFASDERSKLESHYASAPFEVAHETKLYGQKDMEKQVSDYFHTLLAMLGHRRALKLEIERFKALQTEGKDLADCSCKATHNPSYPVSILIPHYCCRQRTTYEKNIQSIAVLLNTIPMSADSLRHSIITLAIIKRAGEMALRMHNPSEIIEKTQMKSTNEAEIEAIVNSFLDDDTSEDTIE